MDQAAAGWYPDPWRLHELRWWDGHQWTAHVHSSSRPGSTASPVAPLAPAKRSRWLGWAGLVLCVVAALALVIPIAGLVSSVDGAEVVLDGSAQQVSLRPHQTYGIYVDDADNSGYSESCSVVDGRGRPIPLRDPSFTVSSSDTENLDSVFDSRSGQVTITCTVRGERVSTKPVPDFRPLLVGGLLAVVAGVLGVVALTTWIVRRVQRT